MLTREQAKKNKEFSLDLTRIMGKIDAMATYLKNFENSGRILEGREAWGAGDILVDCVSELEIIYNALYEDE